MDISFIYIMPTLIYKFCMKFSLTCLLLAKSQLPHWDILLVDDKFNVTSYDTLQCFFNYDVYILLLYKLTLVWAGPALTITLFTWALVNCTSWLLVASLLRLLTPPGNTMIGALTISEIRISKINKKNVLLSDKSQIYFSYA